jgi:hypothetical protein
MAAKKKAAKKKAAVVSGMPDGSGVKRPNTRDDLQAAYDFTKKQKRRSSK